MIPSQLLPVTVGEDFPESGFREVEVADLLMRALLRQGEVDIDIRGFFRILVDPPALVSDGPENRGPGHCFLGRERTGEKERESPEEGKGYVRFHTEAPSQNGHRPDFPV